MWKEDPIGDAKRQFKGCERIARLGGDSPKHITSGPIFIMP